MFSGSQSTKLDISELGALNFSLLSILNLTEGLPASHSVMSHILTWNQAQM